MAKVGIIGSKGRMGQALVDAINEAGLEHAGGVDKGDDIAGLAAASDVLVDFSSPHALETNLAACNFAKKPIVIGTTGLEERHHWLIDDAAQDIAVLQTGNTSLGVTMLALLVFGLAVLAGPPEFADHGASNTEWTLALTGAACLLLIVRRRAPILVWLGTSALAVIGLMLVGGPDSIVLPALLGLYTVASRFHRLAAAGAGVATAVVMAGVISSELDEGWTSPATYAVLGWFALAAAIGDAARSRRAILAAAEDRALRAEQTREEEALRHVAAVVGLGDRHGVHDLGDGQLGQPVLLLRLGATLDERTGEDLGAGDE